MSSLALRRALKAFALGAAVLLSGCDTSRQLLQLEHDSLRRVVDAQSLIRTESSVGAYDPAKYDIHLMIGGVVFNDMLEQFDGTVVAIDAGRPITITLDQTRFAFQPGYPSIVIKARARDEETGIEAELSLYASVLVEQDPDRPDALFLRIVTTKAVPDLRWGPLELGKWRFARRLMQIEAMRYGERLPRIEAPVKTDFDIGGPAGSQDVAIPAGNAIIRGVVTWPSTAISGGIRAPHVLFLPNGVHVFANVEGV